MVQRLGVSGQKSYTDPLHAGRHPFQTLMLVMAVVSGLPAVFGAPTSSMVTAALPNWAAYGWGVSLTVGAATALLGSYWPRKNYATALTIEQIGLAATGFAALVYGLLIIIIMFDPRGIVAAGIILGFGIACLVRALDIGAIIHRAIDMAATGDGVRDTVAREDESEVETQVRRDEGGN